MINPELYTALCRVFGQRRVIVVKQGIRGNFEFGTRKRVVGGETQEYRTICKQKDGKAVVVGEEFRIPCPFCNDRLPRLYINHLWGTKDKITNSRYLWMANCYNEGCTSDFGNRKKLLQMVLEGGSLDAPLREGREMREVKADWPGETWPIYDVAKREPDHPAVKFAYARSWDLQELSECYDVRVIISARYWERTLNDRIIAPVYSGNRELKTWSARLTDPESDQPKWLHCPYVGTGNAVYGLASARKHPVPRVVEGPGDCWPHRGTCAGCFGKVLQPAKAERIAKECADAKAIAMCFDTKQDWRSKMDGKPHHLDQAIETLREYTDIPLIRVEMPLERDPGDLDSDVFNEYIAMCAEEQKIRI